MSKSVTRENIERLVRMVYVSQRDVIINKAMHLYDSGAINRDAVRTNDNALKLAATLFCAATKDTIDEMIIFSDISKDELRNLEHF